MQNYPDLQWIWIKNWEQTKAKQHKVTSRGGPGAGRGWVPKIVHEKYTNIRCFKVAIILLYQDENVSTACTVRFVLLKI